jgi:hypothetical protein
MSSTYNPPNSKPPNIKLLSLVNLIPQTFPRLYAYATIFKITGVIEFQDCLFVISIIFMNELAKTTNFSSFDKTIEFRSSVELKDAITFKFSGVILFQFVLLLISNIFNPI